MLRQQKRKTTHFKPVFAFGFRLSSLRHTYQGSKTGEENSKNDLKSIRMDTSNKSVYLFYNNPGGIAGRFLFRVRYGGGIGHTAPVGKAVCIVGPC